MRRWRGAAYTLAGGSAVVCAGDLRGRVEDESGAGLAGVLVSADDREAGADVGPSSVSVVRDADGAFLRIIDLDRTTGDPWTSYAHLPTGHGRNSAVRIQVGD